MSSKPRYRVKARRLGVVVKMAEHVDRNTDKALAYADNMKLIIRQYGCTAIATCFITADGGAITRWDRFPDGSLHALAGAAALLTYRLQDDTKE